MRASCKTTGIPQARSRIDDSARRARSQTQTFQEQARRAQRSISGIPVDTGRLAASAHGSPDTIIEAGPWGFAVLSAVPYAPFVFRGTSRMRARPPRVARSVGTDTARAVSRDLDRAR